MRGKCWVCSRQARGLGYTDNRQPIGDAKRYPLDWVFCSRQCQDVFHRMYGNWVDAQKYGKVVEMIDATDIERSAMRSCLRAFGEAAGDIGFDKPLGAYSEKEALKVIDAIVTRYTEAMVVHHAEVKYPPEQRHLVWMRANRYEWQQIGRRFACDRNTAARRWGKAIDFVVTKLNACLQR